jgi:hypothetical protein
MDSGWAVVLGAAIALVGSAIVPWIREAVTERARSTAASRHELADAIHGVIEQGAALFAYDDPAIRLANSELAVARFTMLITVEKKDIATLVQVAINEIQMPHGSHRAAAYVALSAILPDWFRGELSAPEALARYNRDLAEDQAR